jgi:hypothetical protein
MNFEKQPQQKVSIWERLDILMYSFLTNFAIRLEKVDNRWCSVLYPNNRTFKDTHQLGIYETTNKYLTPFRAIREKGYQIIDLENPEQQRILEETIAKQHGYTLGTPAVVLTSNNKIQMLDHHRISASLHLGMPIVVNVFVSENGEEISYN